MSFFGSTTIVENVIDIHFYFAYLSVKILSAFSIQILVELMAKGGSVKKLIEDKDLVQVSL